MTIALRILLFMVAAIATQALGQDSWLCTEDSSQIQGSRIIACGVGEHAQESLARRAAFDSAVQEFASVCGPQTLCGQHKYRVQPSRSTCENDKGVWKCYRAVVYEIEKQPRDKETVPVTSNIFHQEVTAGIMVERLQRMEMKKIMKAMQKENL